MGLATQASAATTRKPRAVVALRHTKTRSHHRPAFYSFSYSARLLIFEKEKENDEQVTPTTCFGETRRLAPVPRDPTVYRSMFTIFADRTWLWAAAGFYAAGFLLGTVALLRHGRPSGIATYSLIAIGYILQLIGLGIRGKAVGGCPLGNQFELYQFVAWSAITLYLLVGVTFRNSLLGYFTACLAAAMTAISLAVPAWDATQRTHIFGSNPWIELHAALAVFSYGVFGLLALTSMMFLLRNHSLKSKHLSGWFSFLPSILDLDHIGVRLLGAGVAILTAALAIIGAHYLRDVSSANLLKIASTTLIWVAYAITFGLRIRGRLLAKRFAWSCIVLFVAALVTVPLVDRSRYPATSPTASAR